MAGQQIGFYLDWVDSPAARRGMNGLNQDHDKVHCSVKQDRRIDRVGDDSQVAGADPQCHGEQGLRHNK